MKIKKIFVLVTLGIFSLSVAGCSSKNSNKKIQQGNEAIESGNYEEALEVFGALKKSDGDKTEIYRGLGISYIGLGDYENGIKALKKSLQQSDGTVGDWEFDTSFYLAMAYEKNGQRKEAIDVYTNILELKKDKEAYFQRGILYLKNGKTEKAMKDFDNAIEMDKKNLSLYLDIYEQWELAEKEGGEKYLQLVLEAKASEGEDLYYRGLAYEKLGEENAAIDTLRQAIDKGYSKANLALGRLYDEPESKDAALACYEAYLEANSTAIEAYQELANYQIASGDYQDALVTVQDGLSLKDAKDTQGLLKCEIACYEYLQDYETARNKAAEYLENYPYDKDVQKELEFLQTR